MQCGWWHWWTDWSALHVIIFRSVLIAPVECHSAPQPCFAPLRSATQLRSDCHSESTFRCAVLPVLFFVVAVDSFSFIWHLLSAQWCNVYRLQLPLTSSFLLKYSSEYPFKSSLLLSITELIQQHKSNLQYGGPVGSKSIFRPLKISVAVGGCLAKYNPHDKPFSVKMTLLPSLNVLLVEKWFQLRTLLVEIKLPGKILTSGQRLRVNSIRVGA